jgi:hypothetical protein
MMYPLWRGRSEPKVGRGGDLLLKPRPGSGEDAIPPKVEVEAEPWGRARRRPPGVGKAETTFRGRGGGRALRSGEAETSS